MTDYSRFFESREREDGERFVCLVDDAPKWLRDAVFEAHGDFFLPDDWTYAICRQAIEEIDTCTDEGFTLDDVEGPSPDFGIDVYSYDLWQWANPNRWYLMDDLVESVPFTGVAELIMWAQADAAERIFWVMLEAVRNERRKS